MKVVPIGGIITSKIDSNYYVIKSETTLELFMLVTALQRYEEANQQKLIFCNIIMDYIHKLMDKTLPQYPMFVSKTSELGEVITTLIQTGELMDKGTFISKNNIINAFINEMQNSTLDLEYLKTIGSLIKDEKTGSIKKLSGQYSKQFLEKIIQNGGEQNYLKSLNDKLTGQEEEGYLYENNSWYQFNIMTNTREKVDSQRKIRRLN